MDREETDVCLTSETFSSSVFLVFFRECHFIKIGIFGSKATLSKMSTRKFFRALSSSAGGELSGLCVQKQITLSLFLFWDSELFYLVFNETCPNYSLENVEHYSSFGELLRLFDGSPYS